MIQLNWGLKRAYRRVFPRYGIASPIVVHSLGKSGTISVAKGLRRLGLSVPVYHTHGFSTTEELDRREESVRRKDSTIVDPAGTLHQIAEQREAWGHFERWHGGPWNLISLVRDPVGQCVSALFQWGLKHLIPWYNAEEDISDRLRHSDLDIQRISELLLEHAKDRSGWFDQHVRDPFGIDVFATPFPKQAGYAIYEGRIARLMVLRLEDLDRCAGAAFRQFLNIRDFRPPHVNAAEQKSIRELYQRFKREAVLPEDFLDRLYSSRLARHFYTHEELEQFKRKWMRVGEVAMA